METEECDSCCGKGEIICPACNGGPIAFSVDTKWESCSCCHGKGKVKCEKCKGTGQVKKSE
jgi:DnaJ-class molecular chaperone